jgi:hypothetical protein
MRRLKTIAATVGVGAVVLGAVAGSAEVVRPNDGLTWISSGTHHHVVKPSGLTWTAGQSVSDDSGVTAL